MAIEASTPVVVNESYSEIIRSRTGKKSSLFILDASALINSRQINFYQRLGTLTTVPSIVAELKDSLSMMRLTALLESGVITVRSPCDNTINIIRETALTVGSLDALSFPDIEVLALALELKKQYACIISDDLEIQNLASFLGLRFRSSPHGKMIHRQIRWNFKCDICGSTTSSQIKVCPHCGGPIKKHVQRYKSLKRSNKI